MSREWKPGDVAMFTIQGAPLLAMRDNKGSWSGWRAGLSWVGRRWDGKHGQRPVVVIDPDDREQVERLVSAFYVQDTWSERQRDSAAVMQDILREFANPSPPKCGALLTMEFSDGKGIQYACDEDEGHDGAHCDGINGGASWTARAAS